METKQAEAMSAEQAADLAALESVAADDPGAAPEPENAGQSQSQSQSQGTIPGSEIVAPVIGMLCRAIAPRWGISTKEQAALADAYGAVLDKYFPGGVPMGPEVTAIMITAGIVLPRLGTPMRDEPEGQDGGQDGGKDED